MTSKTIIESFELELKACVREVPGKRRIFKGIWDSQDVYVKIFEHPTSAKRHFDRELKGLKLFQENKILTPNEVWYGALPEIPEHNIKKESLAIVTEEVKDCYSFNDFYLNSKNKTKALSLLLTAVLNHHKAGFIQTDLHPGNFLLANNQIYSLDGDALELTDSESAKANNLALLFAQFPVSDHDLLMNTLRKLGPIPQNFESLIFNSRAKRCSKYLKKVFRQCTEIEHNSKGTHKAWIKRDFLSNELKQSSQNPESLFPENPEALLKNGNTASVALAKIGTLDVVIKRNNYHKNFKAFTRRFRRSRSAISWENAFRLLNYGLKTPLPVALIEKKMGPMLLQAYIITEKCEGPDALDYFSKHADNEMADKIITMFKVFEKCQITHGDCKATNFIISEGEVNIIDLDAMREHKDSEAFKKYFRKDLKRWMANWADSPETSTLFLEKFKQAELSQYL